MQTQLGTSLDIIETARTNDAFRREVITGEHQQVVVMAIPPGGEIGEEVHPATDQLLLIVEGVADARIGSQTTLLGANDLLFVRAGTRHNVVSIGPGRLRLISVYAPPQHRRGTVHNTKEDADAAESAWASSEQRQ